MAPRGECEKFQPEEITPPIYEDSDDDEDYVFLKINIILYPQPKYMITELEERTDSFGPRMLGKKKLHFYCWIRY